MRKELDIPARAYSVSVDPDVEYKRVPAAPKGVMDQMTRGLCLQILAPRSEDRTKPEGLHPIVVYPMGGGWRTPLTRQRLPMLVGLAARGYVVAIVEYRGREYFNSWREAAGDVRSAVRYMRRHGRDYNGDPERMVLMGESAGGHLGPAAAYSGDAYDDLDDDLTVSATVSGVIEFFGPSDPARILREILEKNDHTDPASLHMIDNLMDVSRARTEEEALEKLEDMSVLKWVTPSAEIPPTLIAQGDADDLVPAWNADVLYEKLTANGFDAEYYLLHGARHGDMRFYGPDMLDRCCRFIERVTGGAEE